MLTALAFILGAIAGAAAHYLIASATQPSQPAQTWQEDPRRAVAMLLHTARRRAGLSTDAVGRVCGVTAGTVARWESGRCRPRHCVRVAEALDLDDDERAVLGLGPRRVRSTEAQLALLDVTPATEPQS